MSLLPMERIFSSHVKFSTMLCFFILRLALALFWAYIFPAQPNSLWTHRLSLCLSSCIIFDVILSRNISRGHNFFQYPSGYWACDFQYPNLKSGIARISGYRKFEALDYSNVVKTFIVVSFFPQSMKGEKGGMGTVGEGSELDDEGRNISHYSGELVCLCESDHHSSLVLMKTFYTG